jgi:transposase
MDALAIKRYLAGESATAIAKDYKVSGSTIRRFLRASGVQLRSRGGYRTVQDCWKEEIELLYLEGKTAKQIAEIFNLSIATILEHLSNLNLIKRTKQQKMMVDEQKIEAAYTFGLPIKSISKKFNIGGRRVSRILKLRKIKLRDGQLSNRKKAEVITEQVKELKDFGMPYEGIDRRLGLSPGRSRRLLKKYLKTVQK